MNRAIVSRERGRNNELGRYTRWRPPYSLPLLPGPDDFIVTASDAFGAQLAVWAF
jgi:hypothetical protein